MISWMQAPDRQVGMVCSQCGGRFVLIEVGENSALVYATFDGLCPRCWVALRVEKPGVVVGEKMKEPQIGKADEHR